MSRFVNFAATGWFRVTPQMVDDMVAEGEQTVLERIRDRIAEVLSVEFDGIDHDVAVTATATPERSS